MNPIYNYGMYKIDDVFLNSLTPLEWNCVKNVSIDKEYGVNYRKLLNKIRSKWITYCT